MSWDHGYFSDNTYINYFYVELAPNWIDFALLVKGIHPPRPQEGATFSYLELGSGMGFNLCLLAAAYPEGSFVGVDFQPEHVAYSQWLSTSLGLTNLRFLEADFIELQGDASLLGPSPQAGGGFHYVAAHGIATWVTPPVQEALLAVAAASLIPGGVFYCSYNTSPGWLGQGLFRHLAELERQRHDPSRPELAYQAAATSLLELLGDSEHPNALGKVLPALHRDMVEIASKPPNYLLHEYGNQGWNPIPVSELHGRCSQHKLRYVATATLPELFDELLVKDLHPIVLDESNPIIRQTLLDLATNKTFRRDLFSHGAIRFVSRSRLRALSEVRVRLNQAQPIDRYSFITSFGEIVGPEGPYSALEAALEQGPMTLETLQAATQLAPEELLPMVSLLLSSNRLCLDRHTAGEKATPSCQKVNAALMALMKEGHDLAALTSPASGSGVAFNVLEAMCLEAQTQGLNDDEVATCVLMGVGAMDGQIRDKQGQPITETADQVRNISELAGQLARVRLPQLRSLGVLPGLE
jgi:SAM-dependent methyltransferase